MRQWTEEQRKAQSEKMKQLKPWLKSTGPKSEEGKKKASLNAMKHGLRSELARDIRKTLREQAEILKGF